MTSSLAEKVRTWELFARDAGYSAGELANYFRISDRHLRRLFVKRFGRSPQVMLDEKQLKDAQAALVSEHLVKKVAFEMSYKHPASFSHWFRAKMKMTPSKFAAHPI